MSSDDIVEWLIGNSPQERLDILTREKGHTMGPWHYVGEYVTRKALYRHPGRTCTVCGLLAVYGNRPGHIAGKNAVALALWGSALLESCPGLRSFPG